MANRQFVRINTISGLNGAIPTVWDDAWQIYTDLSSAQIAAFQAMPEWQTFVDSYNSWVQSLSGGGRVSINTPASAPSLTVDAVARLTK